MKEIVSIILLVTGVGILLTLWIVSIVSSFSTGQTSLGYLLLGSLLATVGVGIIKLTD